MQKTFLGYRRENGRVGVRNHVIVLPVDDLSNAAAEAVAHNIKGAMAIPHPYGRLQFGADLDLHFRTLIGTGCNPNVAAVVVIGIEDGWTQKVVDGIKATGKPVCGFGIELHGDHDTIMRASKAAREFVQWASEKQREACPIHELWVSTKCGESDTTSGCGANPSVGNAFDKLHPLGNYLCFGETTELTGGEHIVAARCASDAVRERFMFMFDRYQEVINRHKTSDLSDSQPTKGNIAGGLTTIEEKALGNIQKIGKKCTVDGVIDKAETPTHPGLWFMDSSSAAAVRPAWWRAVARLTWASTELGASAIAFRNRRIASSGFPSPRSASKIAAPMPYNTSVCRQSPPSASTAPVGAASRSANAAVRNARMPMIKAARSR